MGDTGYNSNRFKSLVHYVIHKCGHQENVGKTVLFKVLYFSDFDHYELFEKPLTGEEYVKLPHGPAPRHFEDAINSLKKDGKITEIAVDYKGKKQNKYFCNEQPQEIPFSGDEIQLIDRTIARLSSMNATQISAYSHGDMPWKSAKEKELLDYEMVFYRDETYSVREYD